MILLLTDDDLNLSWTASTCSCTRLQQRSTLTTASFRRAKLPATTPPHQKRHASCPAHTAAATPSRRSAQTLSLLRRVRTFASSAQPEVDWALNLNTREFISDAEFDELRFVKLPRVFSDHTIAVK